MITILWDVSLYLLGILYRRFGGDYHLNIFIFFMTFKTEISYKKEVAAFS
jgi:hypothetical protein